MSKYSLTIDHTKVSTNLTDFPVYVNLADVKAGGLTTAEASSIRVYKADGTTEVPREIVSTGEMHFKGDISSTTDTIFVINIDGARSDYTSTDTYGRNAVWSDYVGVWHLSDMTDSTGNGNDGENSGTTVVTGQLGDARQFDGSSKIIVPYTPSLNRPDADSFSVSAWFSPLDSGIFNPTGLPMYNVISSKDGAGGYLVEGRRGTMWLRVANGSGTYQNTNVISLVEATWGQTALSHPAGGGYNTYGNGVSKGGVSPFYSPNLSANFLIGSSWVGLIDEVRVATVARSTGWIATEYANQNSPSSFYSLSEIVYSAQGIASIQGVTSIVL